MNSEFEKIIDQLPDLLKCLLNSSIKHRTGLSNIPEKGIYVFYESGNPIYVGRTNRMKDRILEHGRPSSNHNKAPFAFNLAKKTAVEKGVSINEKRDDLEKKPVFDRLFTEAKKRVSQMAVRVIRIDDPIIQAVFEVYASMQLKTEFNDFDTH